MTPTTAGRLLRADGTLSSVARVALLAVVLAGFLLAASDAFPLLFYGSYVAIGLVLAIRRPRNAVSWMLIAIAFGFIAVTSRLDVDVAAMQAGHPTLSDALKGWLAGWMGPAFFVAYAALTFVFPAGTLPPGPWRRTAVIALGGGLVVVALVMVQPLLRLTPGDGPEITVPNPFGVLPDGPWWDAFFPASYLVPIGALAIAIASLFARYRAGAEQLRLQLRWLLAAMALLLFGIAFGLAVSALHGDDVGGLVWIPAIVAYPSVPVAIGVAVLRYRLYEIDRIVNRAIVYGTVTAILAGAFAAATAVSQRLVITIAGESTETATVLTTLVVVALYAPVRKRVEAVVDRRFKYEERQYGPYLDELRRLLDLIDPSRAAARLAREARSSSGAAAVAIVGRDGSIIATAGPWTGLEAARVDIPASGSPLAAVLLAARPDGRPLEPDRLTTLANVAAVVATALGGVAEVGDQQPALAYAASTVEPLEPELELGRAAS
jgi:hypothetical protein